MTYYIVFCILIFLSIVVVVYSIFFGDIISYVFSSIALITSVTGLKRMLDVDSEND